MRSGVCAKPDPGDQPAGVDIKRHGGKENGAKANPELDGVPVVQKIESFDFLTRVHGLNFSQIINEELAGRNSIIWPNVAPV